MWNEQHNYNSNNNNNNNNTNHQEETISLTSLLLNPNLLTSSHTPNNHTNTTTTQKEPKKDQAATIPTPLELVSSSGSSSESSSFSSSVTASPSCPCFESESTHNHPNDDDDDDDGTKRNPNPLSFRNNHKSFRIILQKWMKRWKISPKPARNTVTTVLILLCVYWWRRRRRQQGGGGGGGSYQPPPQALPQSTRLVSFQSTLSHFSQLTPTLFVQYLQRFLPSVTKNDTKKRTTTTETPFSLLLHSAQNNLVSKILLNDSRALYQLRSSSSPSSSSSSPTTNTLSWHTTKLPTHQTESISQLISILIQQGITPSALPKTLLQTLYPYLLHSSPFLYLYCLYRMLQHLHNDRDGLSSHHGPTSTDDTSTSNVTTFRDVAGVDTAQEELKEVVGYLEDPRPWRRMGAGLPRGVLLYGPPGNGKTLLARAVAGEASADYFIGCSGSDFVEIYVGQGARRVRNLFSNARTEALRNWRLRKDGGGGRLRNALNRYGLRSRRNDENREQRFPTAVVFIDEIDALAKCRDGIGLSSSVMGGNDEREQTLNALLTELDGFHTPRHPSSSTSSSDPPVTVVLLAATNRPSVLDPALLRPGRFDRHVLVSTPDRRGREAILKIHARGVALRNKEDLVVLAGEEYTKGYGGAELKNVVNEAALAAVREGVGTVGREHLVQAAKKVGRMRPNRRSVEKY